MRSLSSILTTKGAYLRYLAIETAPSFIQSQCVNQENRRLCTVREHSRLYKMAAPFFSSLSFAGFRRKIKCSPLAGLFRPARRFLDTYII